MNTLMAKVFLRLLASAAHDKKTRNTILFFVFLPLIIIVMLLASPLAVFFGSVGAEPGSSIPQMMTAMHEGFKSQIHAEQSDPQAISVDTIYMNSEDNSPMDNRQDVMSLFAVDQNLNRDKADVLVQLKEQQGKELTDLYWKMNRIEVERVYHDTPDDEGTKADASDPVEPTPEPRYSKTIRVTSFAIEDMVEAFRFSPDQNDALDELMKPDYAMAFLGIIGSDWVTGNVGGLTPEEIQQIIDNMPDGLSLQRMEVVKAAESLVGKVKYFWGGKSYKTGWDDAWGEKRTVSAQGSKSTGTSRPFGLDCSGFTAWVFIQAGVPVSQIEQAFGTYTGSQWEKSSAIDVSELIPGDLGFQRIPGSGTNHVGIYVGDDMDGTQLFAHSSSSKGGVVITPASGGGLKCFRRPALLESIN